MQLQNQTLIQSLKTRILELETELESKEKRIKSLEELSHIKIENSFENQRLLDKLSIALKKRYVCERHTSSALPHSKCKFDGAWEAYEDLYAILTGNSYSHE